MIKLDMKDYPQNAPNQMQRFLDAMGGEWNLSHDDKNGYYAMLCDNNRNVVGVGETLEAALLACLTKLEKMDGK